MVRQEPKAVLALLERLAGLVCLGHRQFLGIAKVLRDV
jgi:hypothetical protein